MRHLESSAHHYLMYSVLSFSRDEGSENMQGRSDSTCCFHGEGIVRRIDAGNADAITCLTYGFIVNDDSGHVLLLSHPQCPADDSESATGWVNETA
ncbi:hypothetical protein P7K49_012316 [Saguinus oedipus]|uniref:Uncharacterized protein n=1 Tax=Saguinus oedipus TaxID=9490 RepID=A0ABQ9VUP8_SAGOE|nr:hypothetical protein P7K49_012316 [Saguinus oedipus]